MTNDTIPTPTAETATTGDAGARCRGCGALLEHVFVDLGASPPCESYVLPAEQNAPEAVYPLKAWACHECFLVQLEDLVDPGEIFPEYAYFSSFSDSWLEHARQFASRMVDSLGLGRDSLVVELASNDGYLLQYFLERGVPVLGIDPAANVAEQAEARGVRTLVEFFDEALGGRLAADGIEADLVVGNNVLAQVADLHGFIAGIPHILSPRGLCTIEVPHLLRLMQENQFDTIYHEHYSYFSVIAVEPVFAAHGLELVDVEELPTHGGSLRLHLAHAGSLPPSHRVSDLLATERDAGLDRIETYTSFEEQVRETKRELLSFLIDAKRDGKSVVGYGAPGKGNTLLNYCGIRTDFLDYTVDRNPYKQGRLLPGTRIPIFPPERIAETRPDYVLILPWNLRDEIAEQLEYVRDWGAELLVPIPRLQVVR